MEELTLSLINYLNGPNGDRLLLLEANPFIEKFIAFLSDHNRAIFIYTLLIIFIFYVLYEIKMLTHNMVTNHRLAKKAIGEQARIINEGYERKILVLGDSTGYGTGADTPEDTLTGRFAHDFPHVEVNNYAVNGSTTHGLLEQIDAVANKKYNLTIISSGGNDTWKFTDLFKVEKDLRLAIARVAQIAGKNIVLIVYNNDVSGPVFPFFIRPFILSRTKKINEIYTRVGNEYGVQVVPVFLPGEKCPKNFFSLDGLHPSSEGYRIMYIRLWAALYAHRYDYNLRDY